jgi:hypothetical protein
MLLYMHPSAILTALKEKGAIPWDRALQSESV